MLTKKSHCHNQIDVFAPKPVHPSAERNHALFGSLILHQHMFMDDLWTPSDLKDQYQNVVELLKKRLVFSRFDNEHVNANLFRCQNELRSATYDGRINLKRALRGESTQKLRLILRNRKDLQRLYANLSMEQILDNTNKRTFNMRKERDRLSSHLDNLKNQLQDKLIERENLKTRIKYENEFILEEEAKINELRKNLYSSEVRLKAIKTINNTYRKIIKVTQHDAIYFEPILCSLENDIENQQQFIDYILYMGYPARDKQMEMIKESYLMENRIRNEIKCNHQSIEQLKPSPVSSNLSTLVDKNLPKKLLKHSYARETTAMKILYENLKEVELQIKLVQEVTLCSKAINICPTFKYQIIWNNSLKKETALRKMETSKYAYEKKNSSQKIMHVRENFAKVSEFYKSRINQLKSSIAKEDEKETTILEAIKRHSNVWVVLRFSLWNIFDILRHVDDNSRVSIIKYPNKYLSLPLLSTFTIEPAKHFEENVFKVYNVIKNKLQRVLAVHDEELEKLSDGINPEEEMAENVNNYLEQMFIYLDNNESVNGSPVVNQLDYENFKNEYNIPSRKNIKNISAIIVELNANKEV